MGHIVAAAVIAVVHMVLAPLMLAGRRWPIWIGLSFCAVAVAVSWVTSATLEYLLLIGVWLATFVATLLTARSLGIRLIRERDATKQVSDTPLPTARTQRLIRLVRNPATIALFAVSSLHVWLDQTGTFTACRFLLAGYADVDARGAIVRLDFKDVPAEKLRLDSVGSFRRVTELNLGGSGVSDDDLQHISDLTRLEELYLNSTKITDAGLKHLKDLGNLRKLRLDSTSVTDEGLRHLEDLTHLEVLSLHATGITDDGLKYLENQARLQSLHLSATAISDEGLEHLHGHSALESLALGETKATLVGVCHLAQQTPSLGDVNCGRFAWAREWLLARGDFSADEIRALAEVNIRDLWFEDAALTPGTCAVLPDLRSVQEICLYEVKGTTVAVEHMKDMPQLRALVLLGETVDDAAMEHVANLLRLQHLSLSGTAVSESGFRRLSNLTGLRSLHLEGTNVSDAVLPAVGKLTQLKSLTLYDTSVRDVSPLANLSELKELSLWNTPVPDEKIEKLRKALPDCVFEADY